jgi:hypothetical protein
MTTTRRVGPAGAAEFFSAEAFLGFAGCFRPLSAKPVETNNAAIPSTSQSTLGDVFFITHPSRTSSKSNRQNTRKHTHVISPSARSVLQTEPTRPADRARRPLCVKFAPLPFLT